MRVDFDGGSMEGGLVVIDYFEKDPRVRRHQDRFMDTLDSTATNKPRPYLFCRYDDRPGLVYAYPLRGDISKARKTSFALPASYVVHAGKPAGIDYSRALIFREDQHYQGKLYHFSHDKEACLRRYANAIAREGRKYLEEYKTFVDNPEKSHLSCREFILKYRNASASTFHQELGIRNPVVNRFFTHKYSDPATGFVYSPSVCYFPQQDRVVSSFAETPQKLESFSQQAGKLFPADSAKDKLLRKEACTILKLMQSQYARYTKTSTKGCQH